jgi:hypothetical protein
MVRHASGRYWRAFQFAGAPVAGVRVRTPACLRAEDENLIAAILAKRDLMLLDSDFSDSDIESLESKPRPGICPAV